MKNFFLAILILASPLAVFAEDDLLSILDGQIEEQVVPERAESQRTEVSRDFLTRTTPEQNIFFSFFEKGDYEKALFQWRSAFGDGPYTDEVRALYGLVLFKNGLKVVGLETLFQVAKPGDLPKSLKDIWMKEVPDTSEVWEMVQVGWSPGWTQVFGPTAEAKVYAASFPSLTNLDAIDQRVRQTASGSWERNWLQWQLVLGLAIQGDSAKAARILNNLMTAEGNPVGQPLMDITAARMLYERGFLDASIDYYKKVPKNSEYWWDAQEEMGWAYIRKGEPQNTLAVTQSLVRPEFSALVGAETIFLRALSQLKVCDYPEVVKTIETFRDRFRPKAVSLLEITTGEANQVLEKLVDQMVAKERTLRSLGKMAQSLPRFVTRDETFLQRVRVYKALKGEAEIASKLYSRSLTGGTAEVGFQAPVESIRNVVDTRARVAQTASFEQVKRLAQRELDEIRSILDRMHIVEAELLQQISQVERVIADSSDKVDVKKGTTGSKARDTVWFVHDGEFWFDEISNFQVTVKKGCQAKKSN